MKLYTSPGACGLHVAIALREAKLAFQLVGADLRTRRTGDGRELDVLNPKGYIPVLELDDGCLLTEGAAIDLWAADQAPERGLAPPVGTLDRTRLAEWMHYLGTELHTAFGPLVGDPTPSDRAAAIAKIERRLSIVEARLGQHNTLVGSAFTIADAYLFNILRWAEPSGIALGSLPGVLRFVERTAARDSVRAALDAEAELDAVQARA